MAASGLMMQAGRAGQSARAASSTGRKNLPLTIQAANFNPDVNERLPQALFASIALRSIASLFTASKARR